ncbi:MAG: hypothetical protein Q8S33_10195 [Myxococcales bacterium]|nr:hypothetical protein [Myxococcales bacterium]
MRHLAFIVALGCLCCDVSPLDVTTRRFACTGDEQCVDGFVCRDGACVPDAPVPEADAGSDGGAQRDGGEDAGVDGGLTLEWSAPPALVPTGACVRLTLSSSEAVLVDTPVTLDVAPSTAARVSGDATCLGAVTSTRLDAGTSSTSLFIKPLTAGRVTITARAPFGDAMQTLTVAPIVRRSVCALPAAGPALPDGGPGAPGTSKTCPFSPPIERLEHAVLVTQTLVPPLLLIGSGQVTCRLASTSTIECERRQDSDDVTVYFQVAELPTGLRTVRTAETCASLRPLDAGIATAQLDGGAESSKAFLLKSAASASNFYDDDDGPLVLQVAADVLTVAPFGGLCVHAQLVEFDGVTVDRGVVDGGATGFSATLTGLPAAGPNTALLTQTLTPDAVSDVCSVMVRGAIASPTSLSFSRVLGRADAGCPLTPMPAVFFERVDFGARGTVQQLDAALEEGRASVTVGIRPIDVSRTLVFATSQTVAGQGAGETSTLGPRLYTAATAIFNLTGSTTVSVQRGETTGAAAFTFSVVEFTP